MNETVNAMVAALRTVLGDRPAPLHTPVMDANELEYVTECIKTGWVSSVGSFVDRFEEMLVEITGAKRAIACSNGTSALLIALKLVGVEPEDEVLIPAMTFVATANAVSHCGATPHLLDIESDHLGIDPGKLKRYLDEISEVRSGQRFNKHTGKRISAVVPMHTFGHPSRIVEIVELAKIYGLKVVEDGAESLGSTLGGQHAGTFGDVGVVSFNGNKIVTTGGGGAILTNDPGLGAAAKHLTTTAKVPHRWRFFHDRVGYNFRMPNLNAALGCGQLEQLSKFVDEKRQLADRYRRAFDSIEFLEFVGEPENCRSNYWLNAVLIDQSQADIRDAILNATNQAQIMTRPAWELMHRLPMYSDCPRMNLESAESIQARLINIPSGVEVARNALEPSE